MTNHNRLRIAAVVFSFVGFFQAAHGQPAPSFTSTDTPKGNKGDTLSFSGHFLQKALVSKVYLTDGQNDFVVEVIEQTSTSVKFRIPEAVPPGRYAEMLLTTKPEYIGLTRFKINVDQ